MTPGQLIDLLENAEMLKEESPGVLGWHPTMEKAGRFVELHRDYLLSTEIHTCHVDCQRFACVQTRKAVEAEREACAQVCEARYMGDNNREDMEAKRCASAIRARGNHAS
jgi:hypothetical protein